VAKEKCGKREVWQKRGVAKEKCGKEEVGDRITRKRK